MRVLFSSTRGTGHINPLLPYAHALVADGHDVAIAGPMELGDGLRAAGLQHVPFDHPGDETLAPIWARLRGVSQLEANMIAIREIFGGANARAALPKLLATIEEFRPQLIVRESAEFGALVAAAVTSVPHARVAVHMVSFEEFLPATVSASIDALRQQAGLVADEGRSLRAEPVFTWFPPSLDGSNDDGSQTRIPFRAQLSQGTPSAETPTWAAAHAEWPLVYITFGTIAGGMAEGMAAFRTALDAIAELPVHVLFTTGKNVDPSALGAIPANVHVEAFIPQCDVLSRAAAVVCHGGSGTMLGALAAGVPMVVVPLGADQPHNAQRIAENGAGLALSKPDASTLRAAIERVLAEATFRDNARRLAAEIAALPKLERAVAALLGVARSS
ncbi:MAG TPA: glycosyltransferase [Polyangiales bacterium]|nr:glycosyltransferase [Polyangiales bacterium]